MIWYDTFMHVADQVEGQLLEASQEVTSGILWRRGPEWTTQATIAAVGCLFSLAPLVALEYMAHEVEATAAEVIGRSNGLELIGLIVGPIGIVAATSLMMIRLAREQRNHWQRIE